MTPEERWWSRVEPVPSGCWQWRGRPNNEGYVHLRVNGRTTKAHRFGYELLVGPIPDGLVLDHLCRNRACVNPTHLEPVTSGENTRRGETLAAEQLARDVCIWGHPLDRLDNRGKRVCRTCNSMRGACFRVAHGIGSERDHSLAEQAPWTFGLEGETYRQLERAS